VTVINDEVFFRPANNIRLANLCGQFDENIKLIESCVDVEIGSRGDSFFFSGTGTLVECAKKILRNLYELAESRPVHADDVHLEVRNAEADEPGMLVSEQSIQAGRSLIRARGANQKRYLSAIKSHDISFGVGPAGTGKTYLAVAAAVDALENDRVRRVCLVRPAVEAGERLGFLPGDMAQKIDPYLRPLYDALYEMLGFEKVAMLIERNSIEIAPLAFMRGRTLNESFVILDEAQNTTTEQMKMFLTRLGFGSQAVVTGDVTQIDLPRGRESGLKEALAVLKNVPGMSFTCFKSKDVVRHSLVAKILDAYADHE
jgi:phosphate starvation-inducible PhoH-like protein